MQRTHGLGLVLLALTSALVACGDDGGAAPAPAAAEGDAVGRADAFPVTIEHRYGETTIEAPPERIVTVGLTDQDALLSLGVVPVATTEWFGDHPGAVWPWAQDELEALGAEPPEVLGDATAINFEAIAVQRPDLILAVYGGVTDDEYDQLAAIAPTVAQPDGYIDFGVPWDEQTRIVGRAVGLAEEADAVVQEVEDQVAVARGAHPEFEGASAAAGTPYEGIYVYGPQDVRGRFLTDLGFVLPAELAEIAGDEYGGELSMEHVDLLDVEAMIWLDVPADRRDDGGALYDSLGLRDEGREVFIDSFGSELGGATSFVSVLSMPFLLDGLVPMLAAAVDGDPSTEVPEAG